MNAELEAQTDATHKKKGICIPYTRKADCLMFQIMAQFPRTLLIWQPLLFVSCNVRHTAVASLMCIFSMQVLMCANVATAL